MTNTNAVQPNTTPVQPANVERVRTVAEAMHPDSVVLVQVDNCRVAVREVFWDAGAGALVLSLVQSAEFVPAHG